MLEAGVIAIASALLWAPRLLADRPQPARALAMVDLPDDTRAEVDQVIELWAERHLTAADGTAGAWFKATRSLYDTGVHFVQGTGFSAAKITRRGRLESRRSLALSRFSAPPAWM